MKKRSYSYFVLLLFGVLFLLGSVWTIYLTSYKNVFVTNDYDLKRFLLLFFVFISSVLMLFVKKLTVIRLPIESCLAILCFFILGGVSSIFNENAYWGVIDLSNYFLLLVVFYVLSICCNEFSMEAIYTALYWLVLVFSLFLFVQFFLNLLFNLIDGNKPNIHHLISGFINARFLNQIQVILMPFLFLPIALKNLKGYSRISIFFIAFHWMVLFQTEARGALLCLVLSFCIVLFQVEKKLRSNMFCLILKTLLIGIGLWLFFIVALPWFFTGESIGTFRTSSSGRIEMWTFVLNEFYDALLLGYGPMSYAYAEGKPVGNAHPHNFLMQLLYEHGVLIFGVFICWGGFLLWSELVRIKEKILSHSQILNFVAIWAAIGYSFLSGVFVMPFSQLAFVLVLAVRIRSEKTIQLKLLWRLLLIGLVIFCCFIITSSYLPMEEWQKIYPRIWVNSFQAFHR
ncbi:O-antigen ligase family protein [Litoribrevibacter albus]|uniref:O-antigen ligase family protein n=1 Tax=Litoribrevibacter albus TaxID=1473156 RepID=UPI0024E08CE2|nr:O-antigen ligase family protein [Litoribrevibacter albus]